MLSFIYFHILSPTHSATQLFNKTLWFSYTAKQITAIISDWSVVTAVTVMQHGDDPKAQNSHVNNLLIMNIIIAF